MDNNNIFCQSPVIGLGLGFDFTFTWGNKNKKNFLLNFLKGTVLGEGTRGRDRVKGQNDRMKYLCAFHGYLKTEIEQSCNKMTTIILCPLPLVWEPYHKDYARESCFSARSQHSK